MKEYIVEINDFLVSIEQVSSKKKSSYSNVFEGAAIGFAFYSLGGADLRVTLENQHRSYENTKGLVTSFFIENKIEFSYQISNDKPLECIYVFLKAENLPKLSTLEKEVFKQYLKELMYPDRSYVEGPSFYMLPAMTSVTQKIFNISYEGPMKKMFLRSHITELLSHFFARISNQVPEKSNIKKTDKEKVFLAKEIINDNMHQPPSLAELSRQIGLNIYKLKKYFKEIFGVPVYKYLQNERLNLAYHLLNTNNEISVKEVSWSVGYESVSSFSSAFQKKFGFRPGRVKKLVEKMHLELNKVQIE